MNFFLYKKNNDFFKITLINISTIITKKIYWELYQDVTFNFEFNLNK